MEKKILGIDIKPGAIKVVEVKKTGKLTEIVNTAIERFQTDDVLPAIAPTLVKILRKKRISVKKAVVCISGGDIQYKIVELPSIPEKEVMNAIRFKLQNAIQIPMDNAYITYNKLAQLSQKGSGLYFVTVIDREYLSGIVKEIDKAGITVKDIVPSVQALAASFDTRKAENCALLEIGKTISSIVLIRKGAIVFARELKYGSDNISKAMTGVLLAGGERVEVGYEKAEELKNSFGIPMDIEKYTEEAGYPGLEIYSLMRPQLEKLSSEIFRTFEYYNHELGTRVEFDEVFLTGGGSKLKNLADYLSKEMKIKISRLEPSDVKSKQDISDQMPLLALAYGATVEKQGPSISLMLDEFRSPIKYQLLGLVNIYSLSGVFAAVLILIYAWFSLIEMSQKSDLRILQQKGKQYNIDLNAATFMVINEKKYEALGYNKSGKPDLLASIMNNLNTITPDGIFFSSIKYNKAALTFEINGVILKTYSSSAVSGLVAQLKESPYFSSIDLNYLQGSTTYTVPTYDFEIRCTLVPGI